ncbi:ATP-dependent nuclease [Fodinibius sediminis]|uniref:Predicted ATP-dependent endonuclease of the OLD family, contains P-loop ATPase and TOPRIM domains n=1 Tax=Fodinibius sediminis TaxID=1214077 RepID=A0A521F8P5_9BACT|nr:AAA family ATPase [Fodinibius sediminis]SMO92523.1 Predicted ATP-dependent endonuclease of the OLD family, contains P-loop ATPase and TOPRIM domains [Fodinibius sediminis]
MIISSLEIENFRCFKSLNLDIEQLTSIVGENGVGKTTILNAIHFALSPYYLSSRISISDFHHESTEEISIVLRFDESFIAKLPDGWYSREVPCIGVALVIKKRKRATSGKAFSDGFTTYHYLIPDDSDSKVTRHENGWSMPRKMDSSDRFKFSQRHLLIRNAEETELPKSFLFDKNRENQAKIGFNSTLQNLTEDLNWRFRKNIEDIESELIESWDETYNLILNNLSGSQLKATIKPLKEKLIEIIGDEFNDLELSLLKLQEPFSKGFFSLRKDSHQIERDAMGSGISMFLTFLFLDIISNLSNRQIVIMIDEPELHLHPQFQKKLYKYLADSENQIIYTSHSENFIDIGLWKGIRRLDRDFEVHPIEENLNEELTYRGQTKKVSSQLDDLHKYYLNKSSLTKEHNEILFARKCILVEGPIEKYAFDVLPTEFGYNFDELTTIKANGKGKLKNMQLICRAFGIPYFTIFDLDGNSFEDDQENKALQSFALGDNYYAFDNSFEHVIGTQNADYKTSESMAKIESLEALPEPIESLFESIDSFLYT